MGLLTDLQNEVGSIFKEQWDVTEGRVVPEPKDIAFGNRGVALDSVVMYADISQSTRLVDTQKPEIAAEVYKAFLHCAGKIIRSESGVITAYDGDRVMAIFLAQSSASRAVKAALKINWARQNIVNKALITQYGAGAPQMKHVVGIASSRVLAARTGVWGANDIVWVGAAANHAAKLTELRLSESTFITAAVYAQLSDQAKLSKGVSMWKPYKWTQMNEQSIYGSTYWWSLE